MPSLEIVKKYTCEPSRGKWNSTRTFLSGDGKQAIFKNPVEFRMGAYAWDLEVFDGDKNKLFSQSGLQCLHPYQPWSHDSCSLLLSRRNGDAFIYELQTHVTHKLQATGWALSMLGSRRYPRFLVGTNKGEYLLAADGSAKRSFSIRRPRHGSPYLGWFDAGKCFFAVENQGPGLASFRFFDADTGEEMASQSFNPVTVFPYDEGKYESLSRDSWTLVLSQSVQCVGSLMDEWASTDFDEENEVLKLMVYRPTGEIFEKRGQSICQVNENWVELKLRS